MSVLTRAGNALEETAPKALHLAEAMAAPTAVLVAALVLATAVLRWRATRRALRRRVAYAVLPSDGFDPTTEEILRVASQLTKTRRAVLGFFDRPSTAVRVHIAAAGEGRMVYVLEGPAKAMSIVRSVRFDGVEIRPASDYAWLGDPPERPLVGRPGAKAMTDDAAAPQARRYRARAELGLALDDELPLRSVPLRPDPLAPFARALEQCRDEYGESAAVVVDLMAVTPALRRHRLRQIIARERKGDARVGANAWSELLAGMGHHRRSGPGRNGAGLRRPVAGSVEAAGERQERRAITHKLVGHQPAFALQVLVRATSEIRGRPEAIVQALVDAFKVFDGENYLRVQGWRLGPWFMGADAVLRRSEFDRRFDSGRFGPRQRRFVTCDEIAGLLKPPSVHCGPLNVIRSGGLVPPPPRSLPEFAFQAGVLPLGTVRTVEGERRVGVHLDDTFFSYMSGRSRYGKALALDTPLPTATGWTTMGEVRTGDVLFDERGEPCRVVGLSEVMVDHDCFEVVFSDGSVIVADAEHLWRTWSYRARRSAAERHRRWGGATPPTPRNVTLHRPSGLWHAVARRAGRVHSLGYFRDEGEALGAARAFRDGHPLGEPPGPSVVTTSEMARSLHEREHANHAIEVAGALECLEHQLDVDPYVLGAWLGDGTSAHGGITSADLGIVAEVRAAGYEVRKWSGGGGAHPYAWGVVGLRPQLRALELLGDKRIPAAYQRASVKQRRALLEGLMDTDGSCARSGQCEFSSTNRSLGEGVYELVCGLGHKAVFSVGRSSLRGRDCGERYRVTFTPTTGVFRLERKLARQRLQPHQVGARRRWRYIVDVRAVASVPVRCIAVDSPSHLYLAGQECIPTHNTERAINECIHLARSGEGCFFLDPHADAVNRMKPYLTDQAERIIEINLAARDEHRQAAWNLFTMQGLGPQHLEAKQSAIVSSFASAMQWDTGANTRALNLTGMASKTLLELAMVLPPEIAPTIFQMATLLSNEDWRAAVLPHVSAHCRDFWVNRFPKQTGGGEAITPVTNIIDMLRSSPSVAALLGASVSTYDVRRCMDQGLIVLACPSGADDKDRLVANFLVYDVLRAALSRKDTDVERRRRFFLWFDEVQTYDGASRGNLARLLEQVGKFGVKAFLLNQNPRRLTEATREAVFMNSSHVASTVLDADASALVAKQWGNAVEPATIERLERYTYLTSVTLGREVTRPFLVRGFEVSELWAQHYRPEDVGAMEAVIDARQGRRPVAETMAALDRLDEAIIAHLEGHRGLAGDLVDAARRPPGRRHRPRADHVRWDRET